MSTMLRNLFGKKTTAGEREIHVGAFGKHPGWNDHIDDIGLDTERLIAVKRVVYVEGIGANIDAGAWDKLDESKRLEGFAHIFVWRVAGDLIVGRLWSSRDGKGRAKYPMVVAVHCRGVPVRWALDTVLPQLERAQARCAGTESASEVVSIIEGVRNELRAASAGLSGGAGGSGGGGGGGAELVAPRKVVGRIASHPANAAGREGVARVLYQVEREMGAFLPAGGGGGKSRTLDLRPQHIRVPACGTNAGETALQWMQFMYLRLDSSAPVLVMVPLENGWSDVLVGPVQGNQMFCLRASPRAVPLASEIPYTLEPAFRSSVDAQIDSGEEGEVSIGPGGGKRFGGM